MPCSKCVRYDQWNRSQPYLRSSVPTRHLRDDPPSRRASAIIQVLIKNKLLHASIHCVNLSIVKLFKLFTGTFKKNCETMTIKLLWYLFTEVGKVENIIRNKCNAPCHYKQTTFSVCNRRIQSRRNYLCIPSM